MPKKSRPRPRHRPSVAAPRPYAPPPAGVAPSLSVSAVKAVAPAGPAAPSDAIVLRELRKTGILAAALFAVLIIVYFVWR